MPRRDLKSKGLIVAKGIMFLGVAVVTGAMLWAERPTFRTALLLVLLIWASCRFYYFLFYVLEKYVDPSLHYAGLIGLAGAMRRRRRPRDVT